MNTLKEALDYLNYGVKEGHFEEDIADGLTPAEIIELASDLQDKADYAYEAWKEQSE